MQVSRKGEIGRLWVTINVNSFNLVESLLLAEGERQVKEFIVPLGAYTRADSTPSNHQFPPMPTAQ